MPPAQFISSFKSLFECFQHLINNIDNFLDLLRKKMDYGFRRKDGINMLEGKNAVKLK